ncbi:hypothetical protein [Streptomyces sp. URMC 124]|uniref:hypothetical protein n=1 Tax=Streptomyces sp. URMC 124 TaxID=3423405 RepID=UPI003F1CADA6
MPDNATPAEIRLAQYSQRTKTWAIATYNDGTEKALHKIALELKDEIDRLRTQRRFLISQLAKKDVRSGEGDRKLREFLGIEEQLAAAEPQPVSPCWPTAVICGSTKHMDRLQAAAATCTRQGWAVHMPHLTEVDDRLAETLAAMWRALIAEATVVVVVPKPDGSLGDATAGELAYAEGLGKPVLRWDPRIKDVVW